MIRPTNCASSVFVFASTIAVFGEMPPRVTEESLPKPVMAYGAQKLIGEVLVADFSHRDCLAEVLARPRPGRASCPPS